MQKSPVHLIKKCRLYFIGNTGTENDFEQGNTMITLFIGRSSSGSEGKEFKWVVLKDERSSRRPLHSLGERR